MQTVTGSNNSFYGYLSGVNNVDGTINSFVGFPAGMNTTGIINTFPGSNSGLGNLAGSGNTSVKVNTKVGARNLTNATAIGSGGVVKETTVRFVKPSRNKRR